MPSKTVPDGSGAQHLLHLCISRRVQSMLIACLEALQHAVEPHARAPLPRALPTYDGFRTEPRKHAPLCSPDTTEHAPGTHDLLRPADGRQRKCLGMLPVQTPPFLTLHPSHKPLHTHTSHTGHENGHMCIVAKAEARILLHESTSRLPPHTLPSCPA